MTGMETPKKGLQATSSAVGIAPGFVDRTAPRKIASKPCENHHREWPENSLMVWLLPCQVIQNHQQVIEVNRDLMEINKLIDVWKTPILASGDD